MSQRGLGLFLRTTAALALVSPGFSGVAHAQDAGGAPLVTDDQGQAEGRLEDIVVTAQRREERLQDVPISVTALTSEALERQNITDVTDLYGTVSNVWMGLGIANPTEIHLGIRGLGGTAVAQSVTDPPVGLYVDGVYRSRTGGSNVGMIDTERVEVLKGPQGTLFGRNTIGGAFSITTKQPTNELEGAVSAEAGNYARWGASGIINIPIAPDLMAVRLVYQHTQRDGYGYNAFLDERVGSINQDYFRASVKITPSPDFDFTLFVDHSDSSGSQLLTKLVYLTPNSTFNVAIPTAEGHPEDRLANYLGGGFRTTYGENNFRWFVKSTDFTSTFNWNLGPARFKSITAYRTLDENSPGDVDGTPYVFQENQDRPFNYHQFTQEFQLFGSAFEDRLDWIAGLYYLREFARKGVYSPARKAISANASLQDSFATNKNYAVYGQLDFRVIDGVTLTGGLRWTKDSRKIDYRDQIVNNVTGASGCAIAVPLRDDPAICRSVPPTAKFDYWPWTVGVRYEPNEETTLYAKVANGYRSGGFSQTIPAQPIGLLPFSPERLLSYEVGAKLLMLDGRLRLSAAAYYSDYTNVQVQTNSVDPASGVNILVTRNLGDARIYGGELELEALLGKLQLYGSFGAALPKYTSGPSIAPPYLEPYPFVNTAKYTASAGASLPIEAGFGTVTPNVNYKWRSTVYFYQPTTGNIAAIDLLKQPAFGLLGANVDFELDSAPGAKLTVWGENLTGKKYLWRAADFIASGQNIIVDPGDPFTFGATLSYKF